MADIPCPQCGSDALEAYAGIYRCHECLCLVRFIVDEHKPTARPPHPDTMAGRK